MSRYLSGAMRGVDAYVPGEQPTGREYVKLNTNESPFGPCPGAAEAVRAAAERLELYPDPDSGELRRALAEWYGVGPGNVIVGNGSDEILDYCFRCYFPGERVRFPDITYGFYRVFAAVYGASAEEVPLRSDFSVDPGDYIASGAHTVLANPNAPTGRALPVSEIARIAESNPSRVTVCDEAYVDFGAGSAAGLVKSHPNLIVVMTFSKSRSLAGARVGFALADEALIADLRAAQYSSNPYNVNRLSSAAALAALRDEEYFAACRAAIIANREYLTGALRELGFEVVPSLANFVFARSAAVGGERLYRELKERGVLVRHFAEPRIKDYVRITVGSREQLDILLRETRGILEG